MITGLMPSSSNTSSMTMWANPRAEPPPRASAMRGPDAAELSPAGSPVMATASG